MVRRRPANIQPITSRQSRKRPVVCVVEQRTVIGAAAANQPPDPPYSQHLHRNPLPPNYTTRHHSAGLYATRLHTNLSHADTVAQHSRPSPSVPGFVQEQPCMHRTLYPALPGHRPPVQPDRSRQNGPRHRTARPPEHPHAPSAARPLPFWCSVLRSCVLFFPHFSHQHHLSSLLTPHPAAPQRHAPPITPLARAPLRHTPPAPPCRRRR